MLSFDLSLNPQVGPVSRSHRKGTGGLAAQGFGGDGEWGGTGPGRPALSPSQDATLSVWASAQGTLIIPLTPSQTGSGEPEASPTATLLPSAPTPRATWIADRVQLFLLSRVAVLGLHEVKYNR